MQTILRNNIRPSYVNGFARNVNESANPELWQGLVGAFVPSLGITGDSLHLFGLGFHGKKTIDTNVVWVQSSHGIVRDYTSSYSAGQYFHGQPLVTYSIVAMIYQDTLISDSNGTICSFANAPNGNIQDRALGTYTVNNRFVHYVWDGSERLAYSPENTAIAGKWQQVVGTCRANSVMRCAADTVFGDNQAVDMPYVDYNSVYFEIGVGNNDSYMDGKISSVYLYNRIITLREIKKLYEDDLAPFRLAPIYIPIQTTGGGYSRLAIANTKTNWTNAVNGSLTNKTDFEFAKATDSWGTLTHCGIFDAATGGNFLAAGALNTPETINQNDILAFQSGDLQIGIN